MEWVGVWMAGGGRGVCHRYGVSLGNTDFPDCPKLGVWPDAYYMSFNIFAGGLFFTGPEACAYDRTNMLAGATASPMQCFQQSSSFNPILPSDVDGTTAPPSGEPPFFMTFGSSAGLELFKVHV